MLDQLPIYLPLAFGATTLFTFILFYMVLKKSNFKKSTINYIMLGLMVWLVLQAIIPLSGFYKNDLTIVPPRVFLGIVPTFITMILLFTTQKGRAFMDQLELGSYTFLSIVRIPVELCLYALALHQAIPELMTFEGRNFDILAGITAPFIAYFGWQKKSLSKNIILVWNIISLGLLLFIVGNASLSIPGPMQRFGLDQPNIAILHFPFTWLPAFVVPVVMFSHFVSIRRLLKNNVE